MNMFRSGIQNKVGGVHMLEWTCQYGMLLFATRIHTFICALLFTCYTRSRFATRIHQFPYSHAVGDQNYKIRPCGGCRCVLRRLCAKCVFRHMSQSIIVGIASLTLPTHCRFQLWPSHPDHGVAPPERIIKSLPLPFHPLYRWLASGFAQ